MRHHVTLVHATTLTGEQRAVSSETETNYMNTCGTTPTGIDGSFWEPDETLQEPATRTYFFV